MSPSPGTIPILFYGAMRKKFGKRRDLAVSSVADMSAAFRATMPGWREFCQKHDFKILVGGAPIGENQLRDPLGRAESIKIVPVVAGGTQGGDGSASPWVWAIAP